MKRGPNGSPRSLLIHQSSTMQFLGQHLSHSECASFTDLRTALEPFPCNCGGPDMDPRATVAAELLFLCTHDGRLANTCRIPEASPIRS
jgi:hypothetical protein